MDKSRQAMLLQGMFAGCIATLPMTLVMSILTPATTPAGALSPGAQPDYAAERAGAAS